MNWWRGPVSGQTDTERAEQRLDDVRRDDAKINKLNARVQRVRRENHLGPAISRALGARRQ